MIYPFKWPTHIQFYILSPSFIACFIFCVSFLLMPKLGYSKNCSDGDIQFSKTSMIDNKNANILHLNGVGSREKFIFDVYIAALYLPKTDSNPENIFTMPGEKQIQIHFLKDVSVEKLIEGWRDGFQLNHTPEQLESLQKRLDQSYTFFTDMHRGDVIHFNIFPALGTQVEINGVPGAIIEGDDFSLAVLKVWLGKHPPQELLKQCLLGL